MRKVRRQHSMNNQDRFAQRRLENLVRLAANTIHDKAVVWIFRPVMGLFPANINQIRSHPAPRGIEASVTCFGPMVFGVPSTLVKPLHELFDYMASEKISLRVTVCPHRRVKWKPQRAEKLARIGVVIGYFTPCGEVSIDDTLSQRKRAYR